MYNEANNDERSVSWGGRSRLILIAAILLLVLVFTPMTRSQAKIQPALMSLIQSDPAGTVGVIIQQSAADGEVVAAVERLDGMVTKDLAMIHSVAAEMPAQAVQALARSNAVRYVSLDAPVFRTSSVNSQGFVIADYFESSSYNNNDGSINWAGPWQETNDDNLPDAGKIKIDHGSLRLDRSNKAIQRPANLAGAGEATLYFVYWFEKNDHDDTVYLELSADGGQTWSLLDQYNPDKASRAEANYDISGFASGAFSLRYRTNDNYGDGKFRIDNLRINYSPTPSVYLDTIGVKQVWNSGVTGQGVTVAVVDSGIADSPDFGNRLAGHFQFNSLTNYAPGDNYGHGSHVAGIIGGNGAQSGQLYMGVAPGVNLLDVKVSDNQGASLTSDVVSALQWVYDNKDVYNIRVVNLSLNSSVPESYNTNALDAAVEILWFNGVVVVVSAGNNGGDGFVYPPANDPFVITVGAKDDMGTSWTNDDVTPYWSAGGITEDGYFKPDIMAPGANIVSLLSPNSGLPAQHPTYRVSVPFQGSYFKMSGTSMATGAVSGAVSLLLQDEPNLNPDQVKYRLMATATQLVAPVNAYALDGTVTDVAYLPLAGTLNVAAAVNGYTSDSANTNIPASQLLWTGDDPAIWGSVNWNSVNWNSVNWNSVNWNSVNWNSVNWNSVNWDN